VRRPADRDAIVPGGARVHPSGAYLANRSVRLPPVAHHVRIDDVAPPTDSIPVILADAARVRRRYANLAKAVGRRRRDGPARRTPAGDGTVEPQSARMRSAGTDLKERARWSGGSPIGIAAPAGDGSIRLQTARVRSRCSDLTKLS